jgi:hypothetical protein
MRRLALWLLAAVFVVTFAANTYADCGPRNDPIRDACTRAYDVDPPPNLTKSQAIDMCVEALKR